MNRILSLVLMAALCAPTTTTASKIDIDSPVQDCNGSVNLVNQETFAAEAPIQIIDGQSFTVPVSTLANGLYLVTMTDDNEQNLKHNTFLLVDESLPKGAIMIINNNPQNALPAEADHAAEEAILAGVNLKFFEEDGVAAPVPVISANGTIDLQDYSVTAENKVGTEFTVTLPCATLTFVYKGIPNEIEYGYFVLSKVTFPEGSNKPAIEITNDLKTVLYGENLIAAGLPNHIEVMAAAAAEEARIEAARVAEAARLAEVARVAAAEEAARVAEENRLVQEHQEALDAARIGDEADAADALRAAEEAEREEEAARIAAQRAAEARALAAQRVAQARIDAEARVARAAAAEAGLRALREAEAARQAAARGPAPAPVVAAPVPVVPAAAAAPVAEPATNYTARQQKKLALFGIK